MQVPPRQPVFREESDFTFSTFRCPHVLFQVQVKAHSGIRGNDEADRLANEGAMK
jgi:ribonuclease HI